jgi:DNA-binding HxlR family transcriptional regulator
MSIRKQAFCPIPAGLGSQGSFTFHNRYFPNLPASIAPNPLTPELHRSERWQRAALLESRSSDSISQKMLIQQLRQMETNGIVCRIVHHQVPPKVEYCLTKWGQALCPTLDALLKWAALREKMSDPANALLQRGRSERPSDRAGRQESVPPRPP